MAGVKASVCAAVIFPVHASSLLKRCCVSRFVTSLMPSARPIQPCSRRRCDPLAPGPRRARAHVCPPSLSRTPRPSSRSALRCAVCHATAMRSCLRHRSQCSSRPTQACRAPSANVTLLRPMKRRVSRYRDGLPVVRGLRFGLPMPERRITAVRFKELFGLLPPKFAGGRKAVDEN